jgi:hypothetical protein
MDTVIAFDRDVRERIAKALREHWITDVLPQCSSRNTYENVSCSFPPKAWKHGTCITKKQFKLKTFLIKKGFKHAADQLTTDKISLYLVAAFAADPGRFAMLTDLANGDAKEVEGSHLCHSASRKEEEGKNKHQLQQDPDNTCVRIDHLIPDLRDVNRKRAYCWGAKNCDCDKYTGSKYKCIRPGPRAQRVLDLASVMEE